MPIAPKPSRRTQEIIDGVNGRNEAAWAQQRQNGHQTANASSERSRVESTARYLSSVTANINRTTDYHSSSGSSRGASNGNNAGR